MRRLDVIEDKLKDLTIQISTSKEISNQYWNQIQREAVKLYEQSRIIYSEWSKFNIPFYYKRNVQEQIRRIKSLKIVADVPNYREYINKNIHKQTIAIIVRDSISSYVTAANAGQKQFERMISLTQQINLTEKELNRAIAEGFQEKKSLFGARKNLQMELLTRLCLLEVI
jgi:hypothetical protein